MRRRGAIETNAVGPMSDEADDLYTEEQMLLEHPPFVHVRAFEASVAQCILEKDANATLLMHVSGHPFTILSWAPERAPDLEGCMYVLSGQGSYAISLERVDVTFRGEPTASDQTIFLRDHGVEFVSSKGRKLRVRVPGSSPRRAIAFAKTARSLPTVESAWVDSLTTFTKAL